MFPNCYLASFPSPAAQSKKGLETGGLPCLPLPGSPAHRSLPTHGPEQDGWRPGAWGHAMGLMGPGWDPTSQGGGGASGGGLFS